MDGNFNFLKSTCVLQQIHFSDSTKIYFPKLQTTSDIVFTHLAHESTKKYSHFQVPPPPVLQTDCTV